MKDGYRNAYYACLQRNRDEDGDGTISNKEKKWYLASSGQYISLWLGRSSLPEESSLFNIGIGELKVLLKIFPLNIIIYQVIKVEKTYFGRKKGLQLVMMLNMDIRWESSEIIVVYAI